MPESPSDDPQVGLGTDAIDQKVAGGTLDALNHTKMHSKVLRKLDWHILPLVSLLYLLSFLDRANIGNALVVGMGTDLHLVGLEYNTAVAVFFVMYCISQPPSNVILKLVRPSRWIPSIMFAWGLVMTLMCLVKTYRQLLVARVFLGLAEAGLFPGVVYYISSWYPRAERGKRFAIFIAAATVAGAFAGTLAYLIVKMEGVAGLHAWQWLFCFAGIFTVLPALAAPFFIYDDPETASFLTETEKRYITELIKIDSQGLATHYDFGFVLQALSDSKIYLLFIVYIGLIIPGYAIALFTPIIISNLGFSSTNAQLLSIPPFIAGCTAVIIVGIYSDKYRIRGPFVVGGAMVGLLGCIILYTQARPGAALVGLVLAAIGIFSSVPVALAWVSSNAGGDIKRGVAIAMVNGFGNLGGICSSYIFFDPPRYHVGLAVCMGLLSASILMSPIVMWNYNRINKERDRLCSEGGITEDKMCEFTEKGDDSPLFRYTI